jgi:hypothetical protein
MAEVGRLEPEARAGGVGLTSISRSAGRSGFGRREVLISPFRSARIVRKASTTVRFLKEGRFGDDRPLDTLRLNSTRAPVSGVTTPVPDDLWTIG